ncbi:ABC transporter ATP-binding protein [bacterium]|nr:ABC transporter ATP-binding protein [bacterium]
MLKVTDIAYTYHTRTRGTRGKRSVQALRGVSLDARPGDITALVGPNGSGKSTLFRLITGTLRLQEGNVEMNGEAVAVSRIGVVFQSPALDEQLSVFENMRCHGMLYGMRFERGDLPADLLTVLELDDKLDVRVAELSGGYRRRVELAKALLPEPSLLVLDEPFTGLDVAVRENFFRVLQGITAQRALTTLLITHDLQLAGQCDRVALLEEGRLIADDTPARLLAGFGASVVEITSTDIEAAGRYIPPSAQTLRLHDNALLVRNMRLDDAMQLLDEADARISDVHMRRPTLEDYFIEQTGHAIHTAAEGRVTA